jgi:two-component system LytT family response regulator
MFKVLVVDDETIARNNVCILLSRREDIAQIEQADNGEKALYLLEKSTFDIVFLDIHMPKFNGIEVAKSLNQQQSKAQIIFITAFNQHAVEAFEINALDYLLKPFDDCRFNRAVDRAISQYKNNDSLEHIEKMRQALEQLVIDSQPSIDRLSLRETGKIKIVEIEHIKYVKGAGNYVELVLTNGKTLLQRETLKSIQSKLPEDRFSRIHKSTIVRNDLIMELSPTPKGDYMLTLNTGEKLLMSRRNKDLIQRWL